MSDFVIQPAHRSDFEDIASLQAASWKVAYRSFLPSSYLQGRAEADLRSLWQNRRIKKGDFTLLARDHESGKIVGFINVEARNIPFIDNLHCAPDRIGCGIGKSLLASSFQILKESGNTQAYLSVLVGNEAARGFYEHLGAQVVSTRREAIFCYPVDVNIMQWDELPA